MKRSNKPPLASPHGNSLRLPPDVFNILKRLDIDLGSRNLTSDKFSWVGFSSLRVMEIC